jgi:hypothetical protein
MRTRLLAPALGLILLGSSAMTLADDGWKHNRHYGGGHPGWHDRGWKHGHRPHWRGPAHHHHYSAPPRHHGFHAYPPRHHGPHWGPPRGYGGWGPPHYRSSGYYPHGWNRDGITVILRGSFY